MGPYDEDGLNEETLSLHFHGFCCRSEPPKLLLPFTRIFSYSSPLAQLLRPTWCFDTVEPNARNAHLDICIYRQHHSITAREFQASDDFFRLIVEASGATVSRLSWVHSTQNASGAQMQTDTSLRPSGCLYYERDQEGPSLSITP